MSDSLEFAILPTLWSWLPKIGYARSTDALEQSTSLTLIYFRSCWTNDDKLLRDLPRAFDGYQIYHMYWVGNGKLSVSFLRGWISRSFLVTYQARFYNCVVSFPPRRGPHCNPQYYAVIRANGDFNYNRAVVITSAPGYFIFSESYLVGFIDSRYTAYIEWGTARTLFRTFN